MKKRLLSAILTIAMLLSLIPVAAMAATADGLTYEISSEEVTITDCNSSASGELVIPGTIEGYPVTAIGSSAFQDCTSLTSVTIPDSVTSIGVWAFSGCTNLSSVTIGDSVTEIDGCAFYDCDSLESVTIGDSVTTISLAAFSDCDSLKSVTIPDSVTYIGDLAFSSCMSLESITVSSGNESYCSVDGVLYSKDMTELICCPAGTPLTSITIPDSVTTIGDWAFSECTSLTNVTIPDSVTSIGRWAFSECTSLTSLMIPDSVTSIGYAAFVNCTNLTSIMVSSENENYCSVDGILYSKDMGTLICCPAGTRLTSITIPGSVTTIGDYAFCNCTNLKSVTIPDSVTAIGDYAFLNCTSLTNMTIPDSVTTIGSAAFSDCPGLADSHGLVIVRDVVYDCKSDVTAVTIPNSVTAIGDSAFSCCTSLESVTIPNSVTTIGSCAFSGCENLKSVTIPNSVKIIGDSAFGSEEVYDDLDGSGSVSYNCGKLTDIYYSGTRKEWNSLSIGSGNDVLTSALIHCSDGVFTGHEDAETVFTFADDSGSSTWDWASQYIYAAYKKGIFKGDNNGNFNPDNKLTRAEAVTALLALKGITVNTSVTESGFTDADGKWYTPYVAAAKAEGISSGYSNGDGTYSFKPNANITRAEFVTMLLAAMGVEVYTDNRISGFTDADNQWYSGYVATAKENGLSSGYANGDGSYSFKPNANISRAEAATMTAALFD